MLFQCMTDGGNGCAEKESTPPTEKILNTLAEETETDLECSPSLYKAIDPDALNCLFKNRDKGTVTFCYCGYEITVNKDAEIIIEDK